MCEEEHAQLRGIMGDMWIDTAFATDGDYRGKYMELCELVACIPAPMRKSMLKTSRGFAEQAMSAAYNDLLQTFDNKEQDLQREASREDVVNVFLQMFILSVRGLVRLFRSGHVTL